VGVPAPPATGGGRGRPARAARGGVEEEKDGRRRAEGRRPHHRPARARVGRDGERGRGRVETVGTHQRRERRGRGPPVRRPRGRRHPSRRRVGRERERGWGEIRFLFFKEKRKLIYIFASMDSKEKRGKQRRSGRSQGEAG